MMRPKGQPGLAEAKVAYRGETAIGHALRAASDSRIDIKNEAAAGPGFGLLANFC